MVDDLIDETESAAPRCAACGYLLCGLPENRCPECGLRFIPAARLNALRRAERSNWRPAAQGILIVSSSLLLAMQWRSFDPFDDIFEIFFWPVWGLLLLLWLILFACSENGLARPGPARNGRTWQRLLWLPAPILFAVAVAVTKTQAPFRVQFWMSRAALVRLEASARGSKTASRNGNWQAGSFTIEHVDVDATSAFFQADRHVYFSARTPGKRLRRATSIWAEDGPPGGFRFRDG